MLGIPRTEPESQNKKQQQPTIPLHRIIGFGRSHRDIPSCTGRTITGHRKALDIDSAAGEANQDGCEGSASRAVRDISDGGSGGGPKGVRGDAGSDTTNRSDLAEAHTDMTVSEPFVSPTNTREPAMSLCPNDR